MNTNATIRTAVEGATFTPRNSAAIAPAWHTVLMILFTLAPLIQAMPGRSNPSSSSRPASVAAFYGTGTVVLWAWFAFAWWGLRLRGHSLRELVGGRWSSGRHVVIDIVTAVIFWSFWYLVLSILKIGLAWVGMTNSGASGFPFPNSRLEAGLWIVSAISAGIVEEVVFRGYLMRQFIGWSGKIWIGVILQALLFGIGHGFYLGVRQITLITMSGILIGALVLWRQNLRSAMLFHAWADIFGALIIRGLPFR